MEIAIFSNLFYQSKQSILWNSYKRSCEIHLSQGIWFESTQNGAKFRGHFKLELMDLGCWSQIKGKN